MYCNVCGRELLEHTKFCPGCGQKCTSKEEMPSFQSYINLENEPLKTDTPKIGTANKRNLLKIAGIAIAIIFIIILAKSLLHHFAMQNDNKNATIIGEWNSKDLIDISEIFRSHLVNKTGLSEGVAETVLNLIGVNSDNAEKLSLVFTDSGTVRLNINGFGAGVGNFTYEQLDNSKVMLDFSISVSSIPIHLSYLAKYQVTKDTMRLDFFGYEADFIRVGADNNN